MNFYSVVPLSTSLLKSNTLTWKTVTFLFLLHYREKISVSDSPFLGLYSLCIPKFQDTESDVVTTLKYISLFLDTYLTVFDKPTCLSDDDLVTTIRIYPTLLLVDIRSVQTFITFSSSLCPVLLHLFYSFLSNLS